MTLAGSLIVTQQRTQSWLLYHTLNINYGAVGSTTEKEEVTNMFVAVVTSAAASRAAQQFFFDPPLLAYLGGYKTGYYSFHYCNYYDVYTLMPTCTK